jgi:hypothetical protein
MNTDIEWQAFGLVGDECQCIVDGVTYDGEKKSNVDHEIGIFSGFETTLEETCGCTFPCNTGWGDKVNVNLYSEPQFRGDVNAAFLAPNFCCE